MHMNNKSYMQIYVQLKIVTHFAGARQFTTGVSARRRGISGVLVSLSMKLLRCACDVDMASGFGISTIESE